VPAAPAGGVAAPAPAAPAGGIAATLPAGTVGGIAATLPDAPAAPAGRIAAPAPAAPAGGIAAPVPAGAGSAGTANGQPRADRGPRSLVSRPVVGHVVLLGCYLAAGIAVTWPRAAYLTGRVLAVRDVSSYVWDLWWVAHQAAHLGNPWFTSQLAAPAGIQLGYDTTMPLAGLVMAPVTLMAGPAASFFLLTIAMPGLLCYVMYRAARLRLRPAGAITAGALFGLSSMLAWQDWYHLNIAAGTLALPMTMEAAVRLRRCPSRRQGIILGAVIGGSVLVNQESAVMVVILAGLMLIPWLARPPARQTPASQARARQTLARQTLARQHPARQHPASQAPARLASLAVGVLVAVVIASPQLTAMAQQASAGGSTASPHLLAANYGRYGAQLPGLFGPSPRLSDSAPSSLAAAYRYRQPTEGVPTFGLALTALAVVGLAVSWRRSGARSLAACWLGCAALALGTTLYIGGRQYVPLAEAWHGARVSLALPYTCLIRLPGLQALREADRLAVLGLVPAALLAGSAADWLRDHARPAAAAAVALIVVPLAVLEAGWSGQPGQPAMRTALPALDRPIAADQSGSIVLDIPFGLRGGLPLYGSPVSPRPLLLATADGHPRAISYTSWVPEPTAAAITAHVFYRQLMAAQHGQRSSPAQQAAARRDARRMDIGWVLAWDRLRPAVSRYLTATGFRFSYRADGVSVYRPSWPV